MLQISSEKLKIYEKVRVLRPFLLLNFILTQYKTHDFQKKQEIHTPTARSRIGFFDLWKTLGKLWKTPENFVE